MKKKRYAALILIAVLLFTCSCGASPGGASPGDSSPGVKAPVETPTPSPSVEPEAEVFTVSELISEEGTFEDEWGWECSYSYHLPQLDADTPDAAYINDVIETSYGDIVAACRESIEQKIMPDYQSIEWESYQNGPIVSIVLKTITYYSYYESYDVYNYDTERGAQASTSDILAIKGVSEDTYYRALRREVIQYFDNGSFDYFTEVADQYRSDYAERRGWTSSDKNIVEQQMIYLDANGDVASVVPVGFFAEFDQINQVFTVDLDEKPAELEDKHNRLFSAAIENGELTVYYTGESETAPEPYTVHGLYSDYTQILCDVVEETGDAVVFLLTDAGRVEFVDVNKGLACGYFCVNGPILGVDDIVSLETSVSDNGVKTVAAVDSDGEKIDLAPLVQASEQSVRDSFLAGWTTYIAHKTDGGGSYEELCSLEIYGWDQSRLEMINFDAGTEFDYDGWFTFLGTSEAGCVYAYSFAEEYGSSVYEGAAALTCDYFDGMNGFAYYLFWTDLSGAGIFGAAPGEELIFVETFG